MFSYDGGGSSEGPSAMRVSSRSTLHVTELSAMRLPSRSSLHRIHRIQDGIVDDMQHGCSFRRDGWTKGCALDCVMVSVVISGRECK